MDVCTVNQWSELSLFQIAMADCRTYGNEDATELERKTKWNRKISWCSNLNTFSIPCPSDPALRFAKIFPGTNMHASWFIRFAVTSRVPSNDTPYIDWLTKQTLKTIQDWRTEALQFPGMPRSPWVPCSPFCPVLPFSPWNTWHDTRLMWSNSGFVNKSLHV